VLSTNVLFGIQSVTVKDGSLTGLYYDYALAAPVLCDEGKPLSVLVLGNGTGTFARQCRRYFPSCRVEGVEIDGRITALACRYFDMPEEIAVTEYDGRAFLAAVDTKYDVILVDAYQDITIPFQMSSIEFFTLVRAHLNDGGVMVVNMNMHADGAESINARLCDTIAAVFPVCMSVDVPYSTNRELFAAVDGDLAARLARGAARLPEGALKNLMERVQSGLRPVNAGGRVLTDDRAPVELLGMRAIDGLIADELGYYKDVFRRGGIRGILDEIQ
jgi:spermidine synthase